VRGNHPNRSFFSLVGVSVGVIILMGIAAYRVVLAGCPDGGEMDFACLFFPTHSDIGVHFVSYAFIGTILFGTYLLVTVWRRQLKKTSSLIASLAMLNSSGKKLEPVTRNLGLQGKVEMVDFELPFVFCAGATSPRIYLSSGVANQLTREELEVLLIHEKYHLENHDPLKIMLGKILAAALFFFPFLKYILGKYLLEKEKAADNKVVQDQGQGQLLADVLHKLGGVELETRLDSLKNEISSRNRLLPPVHMAVSMFVMVVMLSAILVPITTSHP